MSWQSSSHRFCFRGKADGKNINYTGRSQFSVEKNSEMPWAIKQTWR